MLTSARKLAVSTATLLAAFTVTAPAAASAHPHRPARYRATHKHPVRPAGKRARGHAATPTVSPARRYRGLDVTSVPASPNAPYMGIDTWYAFGGNIDQQTVVTFVNQAIADGVRAAGYRIVWLDGGWWQGQRDANGNIVVDPSQWPNGMAWLAEYIHSKGMLAGIYIDAGQSGCGGGSQGSYGHYQQDVDTFAAWGYDAVKVDNCGGTAMGADPRVLYGQFAQAIASDSPHRPMLLNVCNPLEPGQWGGTLPSYQNSAFDNWSWAPAIATSWRVSYDIGHPGDVQFSGVLHSFEEATAHPAGHGHFNDPDYLVPGEGMTATQARAQFSMWAEISAPMMLSADLATASTQTLAMAENPELIAISQDPAGAQGTQVAQEGAVSVYVKPLADGQKAVMFLNTGTQAQGALIDGAKVGLPGARSFAVRDVWTHETTVQTGRLGATVPADGAVLLRVERG